MTLRSTGYFKRYGLAIVLGLLFVFSASISPLFLTPRNLTNLLTQVSFVGIISVGMTLVILTAGIDLSVGSIVGFSSILFATLLHGKLFTFMPDEIFVFTGDFALTPLLPVPFNAVLVLLVGATIGLVSGSLSYKLKIHSFIITLGMMIFIRGLGRSYTDGQPLFGVLPYVNWLAYGSVLGVPAPVAMWLLIVFVVAITMHYTRLGRRIYAVGGDEEAARLSGIQPAFYRVLPFIVSGVCAALVGILMTGRIAAGDPKIAEGWELDAIGAVVIGGTSLKGGRGSLVGTVIGVLIVGIVVNVMNLRGMEAYPQQMVKGILIVAAVALQNLIERLGKGAR
jgi:ribose/xylose/arabinose/galactoside ABC-type transport system permease subunit